MSAMIPDTDSEDEVPPGWEERTTLDGKVYYANHETKSTQWTHPRTGKKKKVRGELPYGWERKIDDNNVVYYVDSINEKTTYTDPRLAFAVEEKDSPLDIRQRFDANSTGLQVLHGRDLSGKVAVITGANCGIGYETAVSLAYHGCEVYFACRNEEKTLAAISKIKEARPNANLHFMALDLASLSSVQQFCEAFKQRKCCINMLILNAGVFGIGHSLTVDGYDKTFQVNHLSHFYLVQLLQPILVNSAPCRVIILASESHRFSLLTKTNISEERISPTTSKCYYSMVAYNDSKLCNVLFSNELNRRLSPKLVFSNSVHPGNVVSSSISRNWWFYRILFTLVRPFTKSLQQAASTSVYCATAHELESVGGMYFNNCCPCHPSQAAYDEELAKRLWEISQQMIIRATDRRSSSEIKEPVQTWKTDREQCWEAESHRKARVATGR